MSSICELVDDFRLVKEDQMLSAIRQLEEGEGIVAEPAGAAPVAGWLADGEDSVRGSTVLLISGQHLPGCARIQQIERPRLVLPRDPVANGREEVDLPLHL